MSACTDNAKVSDVVVNGKETFSGKQEKKVELDEMKLPAGTPVRVALDRDDVALSTNCDTGPPLRTSEEVSPGKSVKAATSISATASCFQPSSTMSVVPPHPHVDSSIHSTEIPTPLVAEHVIDSALLSALSDTRERVGLLRLEQVIVDFMKDSTLNDIEVGGPCNSIIVVPTPDGSTRMNSKQQPLPGKQTSFQRLCLHRLADRFNISRENPITLEAEAILPTQPCGPGLIRLVKVKGSKIPKMLLIDFQNTNSKTQQGTENVPGRTSRHKISSSTYSSGSRLNSSGNGSSRSMTALNQSLSASMISTRSSSQGSISLHSESSIPSPPKKMVIMKRSSDGFGNASITGGGMRSNSNSSSQLRKNNLRGKNLSERERIYAEAKARIFNESLGEHSPSGSLSNEEQRLPGTANASFPTFPSGPAAPNSTESSINAPNVAAFVPANETFSNSVDSSNPSAINSSFPPIVVPNIDAVSNNSNKNIYRTVTATTGGTSKVTWKNRQVEQYDPDFSRRPHGHQVGWGAPQPHPNGMVYASNTAGYAPVIPGAYGAQRQPTYYPPGTVAGGPQGPPYHYDSTTTRPSGGAPQAYPVYHPNQRAVGGIPVHPPPPPPELMMMTPPQFGGGVSATPGYGQQAWAQQQHAYQQQRSKVTSNGSVDNDKIINSTADGGDAGAQGKHTTDCDPKREFPAEGYTTGMQSTESVSRTSAVNGNTI